MTEIIQPTPHTRPKKSRLGWFGFLLLAGFVGLGVFGILSRMHEEHQLETKTQANAVPSVAVITAQQNTPTEDIILPGTVQAWHEATIYARTGGYLKSWAVDIGAHVKEGDVLAEIDAPDLDAQFHQAQADVATAQANEDLAQITAKRYVELEKTNSIAKQTADNAVATAAADLASLNSAKANLDHLQQEENFKKVVAPFDGTITSRNTDVGALINGGNSGSSTLGQNLFHIAQTDKLRVYIQVPENDAAAIKPDLTAELHFPENPQQVFTGKLVHSADAIDPTTHTLLIELEVDNQDGALLAGGYTDAHLKIPTDKDTVVLPVNTLLFRDGLHVAVVNDNHVNLKAVTLGRDYGKTVEIVKGISPGDTLIINPPDSIADGQEVRVATPAKSQ